jgi:polyisoprenoid-binding protein YceI
MLKKLLITSLFVFSSSVAMAQMTPVAEMPSGKYALDKNHASVTWKVSHLGLSNYTARFTKVDAALEFDTKDPTKSKLVATVNPSSIRTDFPDAAQKDFDKELSTGKEWFNAVQFPEIKFESTKVEKTGENIGKVHGNLTMLGVTKPLVLDVKFNGAYIKKPFADVPGLGFSATTKVKRSEWGFSTYVPNIGDDVEVLIEVEFHKVP